MLGGHNCDRSVFYVGAPQYDVCIQGPHLVDGAAALADGMPVSHLTDEGPVTFVISP
jgi:hypothetical protein